MNVKKYLEQIGRIEKLVANKQLEAQKIRELCGNPAIQTDKERVQTSGISDPTARCATELASITRQIDRWMKKRQEIINQIDMVEDVEAYEVLEYRYVQQMSMVDISEQLEISERQAWRRLGKAHDVFESLYLSDKESNSLQMSIDR